MITKAVAKSLSQGLEQLKLTIPLSAQQAMLEYIQLMHKWNQIHNLTAINNIEEMVAKHLLDSLSILPYLQGTNFIDIGTGAGLPGIPLALACPNRHFTLIDSNKKKMVFVQHVITTLKINNVTLQAVRVQDIESHLRFDGVISRAYASLKDFVVSSKAVCKPTGLFYAMKGALDRNEEAELPAEFCIENNINLLIPGIVQKRCLILLKNNSSFN